MTNDTIDQDVGATQAAVARLPRHAAVRADLDAARMRIMRTLSLGAQSRLSVHEAAEVLGTSVTGREAGQWRGC
jgi:hypothetical protein